MDFIQGKKMFKYRQIILSTFVRVQTKPIRYKEPREIPPTPISQPIPPFSLNLPAHLRYQIKVKHRVKPILQLTKNPSDKNRLSVLSTHLNRLLSNLRNESFTNYTASLSSQDGSIWKVTKIALK